MAIEEFQAVVLAGGRGSRMTELTAGRPKCLMPVGKMPLIYYPLRTLQATGFQEAIVVVLKSAYNQVQQAIAQLNLKLNIELVEIPADEDWGTADTLRFLVKLKKIRTDLLLISCDLFTNGDLFPLLHTFRKHRASFCALLFLPFDGISSSEVFPGTKSKYKPEKDIVGIDSKTSRITFLASASDFEENVPIRRHILKKHPQLSLRTDLVDGHVYVIAKSLAGHLAVDETFSTLKGEFLPYIVSKQRLKPHELRQDNGSALNDSYEKSGCSDEEAVRDLSSYTDHIGDLKDAYHGDALRNYAVVAKPGVFALRINALQALCQANKLCISSDDIGIQLDGNRIDCSANVESKQVDSESFIGSGCVVKEKTSIKTSVIGEGSVVHPKTRISKNNCVICDEAIIGPGCELKNCVVGANHVVAAGTSATSQVLTKSDGLMEI